MLKRISKEDESEYPEITFITAFWPIKCPLKRSRLKKFFQSAVDSTNKALLIENLVKDISPLRMEESSLNLGRTRCHLQNLEYSYYQKCEPLKVKW